jgi:adenosylcobinamide amidohydrolase
MRLPFGLELEPPFLIVRFQEPQNILGWSITKPGFASAREIVWLEVRDADLPLDVDPLAFLKRRLASRGLAEAAAFMTSHDIRRRNIAQAQLGRVVATCVTTVGLSNGEMVGSRCRRAASRVGTINTLVQLSRPLSAGAFVEAISIATQARTAAILETSDLRSGPKITGTGTDCIIVAAPEGDAQESCAGLHTDLGEAIGAAVFEATLSGAAAWRPDAAASRKNGWLGGRP